VVCKIQRHGEYSVELTRESWLDRGCRDMGVSGKKHVLFVDLYLYGASRISVQGNRRAWFLKGSKDISVAV
jgi:hypothetical protein